MRKTLVISLAIVFIPLTAGQSVGAAPAEIDLGTIDRGETRTFDLYLTVSGTESPFTVNAGYNHPSMNAILNSNSDINPLEYSEEEFSSWVNFPEGGYRVDPSTIETYTLQDGSQVRAARQIQVEIEVPRDAEPGYHAGQINLNPDFSSGQGFGTRVMGIARPTFYFRVPGDVDRRIDLVGLEGIRTGENQAQVVATFRNTGTVTSTLAKDELTVFDGSSKVTTAKIGNHNKIPPGETRRMESILTSDKLEGGTYRLEGTLGYQTGEVFVGETFTLSSAPREPLEVDDPDQQGSTQESGDVPWLMIFVAVVILAAFLYYLEFDIFWILAAAGTAIITIFILTADTPVYMILIAFTGVGIFLYLNW